MRDSCTKVHNGRNIKAESPYIDTLWNTDLPSEGVIMIHNYCLTLKVNKCYLALACNTINSVASLDTSSNESWGVSYGIPLLHTIHYKINNDHSLSYVMHVLVCASNACKM